MKTILENTRFPEQKQETDVFGRGKYSIFPHRREEHPISPHPRGEHHVPPHERKNMMHIEFDESDYELFEEVFEDQDTAVAAMRIIHNAPPEVQILAVQLMKMIEEVE